MRAPGQRTALEEQSQNTLALYMYHYLGGNKIKEEMGKKYFKGLPWDIKW
jgi:hypothetical protein